MTTFDRCLHGATAILLDLNRIFEAYKIIDPLANYPSIFRVLGLYLYVYAQGY